MPSATTCRRRRSITSVSLFNKLIDSLRLPPELDTLGHFLNEAVLHKDLKLFVDNFVRFGLWPSTRRCTRSRGRRS